MADIYFEWVDIVSGSYWRLIRLENLAPEDRSALGLVLNEYQIVAGDIGADPKGRDAALRKLRGEMRRLGHELYGGARHDPESLIL